MKRKFLRRLQANFQSVVIYSMGFGFGVYCGIIQNLTNDMRFMEHQVIALLVSFSAMGIGTFFFSLFYMIFGRTRKEKVNPIIHYARENVKLMYISVCKALEKARNRQIQNPGITIYAQQGRI